MYARSTTLAGDATAMDAAIAHVRDEIMPSLLSMDGCAGLSLMVDREGGRCIATSSWDTETAMRASDQQLRPVRERLTAMLHATMTVEEWEVAVMHRDHATHEGTCCRVVWGDHTDVDRGIDIYRTAILPQVEELDGFCSTSLLVNRGLRRGCSTTSFDSRAAMVASRERAGAIRDAGVRDAGVTVRDVAEFELVLAHLRVPEMA